MKRYIKIILPVAVIVLIVCTVFFCGNNETTSDAFNKESTVKTDVTTEETGKEKNEIPPSGQNPTEEKPDEENTTALNAENHEKPPAKVEENVSEEEAKPKESEPQESATNPDDGMMTCSLSVRCDTILDNIQNLDKNKTPIVPPDGKIFENPEAIAYEGESVFNLLSRELRKNKVHFEFTKNPVYNSVYIEGIGNLYEHDCGELSGWMYKVNGKIPDYGCSQYMLKDGDKVEFLYSCNMGEDIK